jgi:Family of unknown function (DUF5670)
VTAATGHRIRWTLVWLLVAAWFVALALNIAGNLVHLLLLGAIGILVYELLVEDDYRGASPPGNAPR